MSKTSLKFVVLVMAMLMMQAMGIETALSAKTVTGTVVSSCTGYWYYYRF